MTTAELTTEEAQQLQAHEQTIQTGLHSFIQVGEALALIQQHKLYRAEHATFKEYVKKRWNISASRAYQLTSAAEITAELSTIDDMRLPENEGQSRALAQFPRDTWPTIMNGASRYSESTGKPLTAGLITRTGSVIMEWRDTGHVDYGNGVSSALDAALTVQESEATARQKEYQKQHYEEYDAQGKRLEPERQLKDRWNKFVKAKPCISCGTIGESEVAHVRSLLSSKTGDALPRRKGIAYYSAIPLCPECHRTSPTSIHSVGETNFAIELGRGQHYLHQMVATLLAEFMLQVARVEVAE